MTSNSNYDDEEKDEVMPLDGTINTYKKKIVDSLIVIKDEPELFSRITMIGQDNEDDDDMGSSSGKATSGNR